MERAMEIEPKNLILSLADSYQRRSRVVGDGTVRKTIFRKWKDLLS